MTKLRSTSKIELDRINYDIKIKTICVQERTDYDGGNSTFSNKYLW